MGIAPLWQGSRKLPSHWYHETWVVGYFEGHRGRKQRLPLTFGADIAISEHMETKPTAELQRLRQWAQEKIDAGSEPPWAWYQYMKLIETVDAILAGMDVTTTENLPQSVQRPEKRLRLVGAKRQQDTSPPHPVDSKVQMPM